MEIKKFTFHVHLPEGIEKVGQPVVFGDRKELGFWENPIVTLRQPFLENPTYWQSEPINISSSEKDDIKYKFAIHIPKPVLRGRKIILEGNGDKDNRTLDIERDNQFAIWKNNDISLNKIRDYAFVDYIFNSISSFNLKDKVMEYQHLLSLHYNLTIRASNLEYITNHIDDKSREKRLFLCLLLGYHVSRQDLNYELPKLFLSELLLDALDNYDQENFSDNKVQMCAAITTLVQHNAFQYQFNWLRIFKISADVDPGYIFIDRLATLKYPSDDLLSKFMKEMEIASPHIKNIEFDIYVKVSKWLIQLCHNNDSLFKLWSDILFHNNATDKSIFKFFIDQVQKNISNDDAVDLESHFKRTPKSRQDEVTEVFRNHTLFLLKNPSTNWTDSKITAMKKLVLNDDLNWQREDIIQSLKLISQSHSLDLLSLFPEILDDWFRRDFLDKEKMMPKISKNWFILLLNKLDNGNKNKSKFVFLVFQQLERMQPLLGHRKNIWQNLTTIAEDKVKACSESQVIGAINFVVQIKKQEVKELFSNLVKELLNKTIQQINNQLIDKLFMVCNCKSKTLEVPNTMCEDILCHIMTRLESQLTVSNISEQHLNVIKSRKFWVFILNATGNVEKLHSNSYVQRIQMSTVELNRLLLEKTVNVLLLQQLLEYSDEQLFQYFDETIGRNKFIEDVIISRDKIVELRKLSNNYQMIFKFYDRFCSVSQVTDVNCCVQNLQKSKLDQLMVSNYWEKTLENVTRCYKYYQSQTFLNIFEDCFQEDANATNVEYIAQKLIPIVFEKYNDLCKQFKQWEKLKCLDASLLWRNVTDVRAELDSMEGYNYKSEKFVKSLDYLAKRIGRLEQLNQVAGIFNIPRDKEDWLLKSIHILRDGSMELGQIDRFFVFLDKNLSHVDENCWELIKELSNAKNFMEFLKEIAEHDILIIGMDDHSDGRLIQEDTVSSLIQVKQFLLPLMNKRKIEDIHSFLEALLVVIKKNHTLGEKIALCNSCNMALQNMYKNISNRGEVTKEKIKNAALNGIYTFTRDEKGDKCLVSLEYTSKTKMTFNLNETLDLRGQALLIAKQKITVRVNENDSDSDMEVSRNIMDDFVTQVNIAQEIVKIVSMLMQMGHFDYRKFKKELQGTDKMKNYLKFLKDELEKWQEIVDCARKRCYYLTFFTARHILAFYDYFASEKFDVENEEECKTLVRFISNKAQLPFRKDIQVISRESKDYLDILCKIGNELEKIFKNISKQPRYLKDFEQRVVSDIVRKGELFVAFCTDKTRVPNIIMSLYSNHGYCPEPWQLLMCNSSTTMEELTIFIKRSFFAANNGYENHLFCIANIELLDFELQYNLVNQVRSMRDQKEDYLLALICCEETGMYHHTLDQFSSDVHATNGLNTEAMREIYRELCQNVTRVSSDLSGQGKTEWIKEANFSKKKFPRNFLISDDMKFDRLVRKFKECKLQPVESLHINIVSSDNPGDVNMFLFELLTLGVVSTNVDIACLPLSETPTHIFIEVASTTKQHLLNSLPMAGYLLFHHLTWNIKDMKVSQEVHSPIQVSCHYLNLLDRNEIDTKEILFQTEKAIKDPLPAERCQNLIAKYFFNGNAEDISSFRFVGIFINVLADQLVRLSPNQFLDNVELMANETNIRTLLLTTLKDVSKDFATRSIKTKVAQLESITADENATNVQWDDSNHLIIFFNSQMPDTISALYRDRTKVHDDVKILLKSQAIGDQTEWELNDYNTMSSNALLVKLEYLARRSTEKLKLPEYALSCDNLIKMTLILLRVRANIPVIICGEAGCGKTSLIVYLAMMVEVQFRALNLHAGIDEKTIMLFMNDALENAGKGEIWVFFDAINTCNHLGLLADLISNRMLNGKLIHPNIRLFSACNPYRLRTGAQTESGLTNKVKKYEEQSSLVYQVKQLPDQILDYVWDYGVLKPDDEYKHIQIMVEKELKKLAHPVFCELLFASQKFIRKVEEPYSVSLRDVKRAITLVKFFYYSLEIRPAYKKGHKYPPLGNPTTITRSYVLALSLCYHSRLYEQDLRKQYRCEMGQILQNHKAYIGENMFARIIRDEQEDYINRMQCPPNTARNEALLENVLVMIVCILTRIPLFLIGAPGSSKSLAIRLISLNLRGSDSNDKYFRKLPLIYLIPHQGSSSSTSDGIIKVFDKAKKYQETTSEQFPVISVVLLDEVGLAETSPFNPLKVLHSLLEPSYPATGPTVSVIGISNWRLDNSKSSRALLVQRPQFDLDDLIDTAERLLNTKVILPGQRGALETLAKAYSDYEKNGQALPNFHGLRDYYALVKRLPLNEMTPENIQIALARNFGGTENHAKLCEKYFGDVLKMFNNHNSWSYKPIQIENLINSNLNDPDARHLMVIGKSDSIVNLLTYQLRRRKLDPVVILGSKFPDDRDDYFYSVLSRIMMCVEAGRPLILTDLEVIYGSLYDLLNQNYIVVGSKENTKHFTRVTLGAYANPMLYVSPNFKCILVMDEKNFAKADPSLLNRFEKQKMSINDILDDRQKILVENLGEWARRMSTLVGANQITQLRNKCNKFSQKDLFIGFDKDESLQSLVIDVTKNNPKAEDDEILEKCKESLIAIASSDGVVRAERSSLERDEVERWKQVYFHQQNHDSLYDYFADLFNQLANPQGHLVIVNTFSNINTDVKSCLQGLVSCQVYKLSTFKTEAQLSNRVKHFWLGSTDHMLILQCDVTTVNAGCIKLAKYIIEQFRNEFITRRDQIEQDIPMKHSCIIFHINRVHQSTFTSFNFMCGWKQIAIESLDQQKILLHNLLDNSLCDVVNSDCFKKIVNSVMPFEKLFKDELLWCLSCTKYQLSNEDYNIHIRTLYKETLNNENFIQCVKVKTLEWIFENCKDWQLEVARNEDSLNQFRSLSLALQSYVKIIIKQTIAKILHSLEKLSAISIFFTIENIGESEVNIGLLNLWKKLLMDNTIININNLPEPELSRYIMSCAVVNELEFPFSYYFVNQINHYKSYYEEELDILSQDLENINKVTKNLHEKLIENHIEDFKNNLLSISPIFQNLEKYPELYYNDFIRIILMSYTTTGKSKVKKELDLIFRHLIGDNIVNEPFLLHIYWWRFTDSILTQLQLVENFPTITTKVQNDFIVHGTLDQYLFKEAINLVLQEICNDDGWEQKKNIVLSLSNKINITKSLPNLSLLLICSDLLKISSVPLEKIKEMVDLGKTIKQQGFINANIIELVFDDLDYLDYSDNSTYIRSFIIRSLELTPIESEIRLSIYKNLFSRKPFQFVDVIIEKIFITENQQSKQIFFTLIKNPENALQLSNRLMTINNNFSNSMEDICCEIIQNIFTEFNLKDLLPYFRYSIEVLTKQVDFVLQKVTSVALLKEFIYKFWENYIQIDNSLSKSLVKEINDCMKINNSFIQSLKSYFLSDLSIQREDMNQLKTLKDDFPWIENHEDVNMTLLQNLWGSVRRVNFKDFCTFYNSDFNQNLDKYPFLSVYFNHYEKLKLIKYLCPIVRFVKILNSKLEFTLTRKSALMMTFNEFIEKESIDDVENGNHLKSLFEEFALGWNSVINYIVQYQCKDLPLNKPFMNLDLPVIFGLIEQKDAGIYLCAILKFLVKLHNEFLDDVFAIPVGKCENLKFLEDSSWNDLSHKTYFIKSIKVAQAQDNNFINYEYNEKILKYSQRIGEQTSGKTNFIFDLQQIEMVLVEELVCNKVYFENEDNQLYLRSFSFKHEAFHNSMRIIFDVKKILPQESIPNDKILLILVNFQQLNSSIILENSFNSINLYDLLFLFETILCFIKELSIKNNNILIIDFVDQWLKLARYNVELIDVLKEFSLKYVIALYELIEEQVANSIIHNIDDKFKAPLTQQMKDSINNITNYDQENQNQQLIPAKAFALALKRFINRFLLIDSNIEGLDLSLYCLDFTLDLWTNDIKEELVENLFPDCLLVFHAYNCYIFIVDEIEKAKKNFNSASSSTTSTRKKLRRYNI